ncbi:MAG: hypothetical protein P4L79_10285 [Legionella sp.]|uniref:hypothetical protein n=1 Tax=Legionella sp. TaxID=459 RepID=UPI0028457627|nr:hypothetical protein [Legionella sp.]
MNEIIKSLMAWRDAKKAYLDVYNNFDYDGDYDREKWDVLVELENVAADAEEHLFNLVK